MDKKSLTGAIAVANNFWGKDDAGVTPLLARMAAAKTTCDELRAFYGGMSSLQVPPQGFTSNAYLSSTSIDRGRILPQDDEPVPEAVGIPGDGYLEDITGYCPGRGRANGQTTPEYLCGDEE